MNIGVAKCCRVDLKTVTDPLVDAGGRFHRRDCMDARDGSARREATTEELSALAAWRERIAGRE